MREVDVEVEPTPRWWETRWPFYRGRRVRNRWIRQRPQPRTLEGEVARRSADILNQDHRP